MKSFLNLELLFPDTDLFPNTEEIECLNGMIKGKGHVLVPNTRVEENLVNLAKRGFLGTFTTRAGVEFYVKGEFRNRPITVEFNAYHIKMGQTPEGETKIISESEKQKSSTSRSFIAKWVFRSLEITNVQHINFLTTFISSMTYTLSIPAFLWEEFKTDIEAADTPYKILTPIYKTVHCPYCRNESLIKDTNKTVECSKCHSQITIR